MAEDLRSQQLAVLHRMEELQKQMLALADENTTLQLQMEDTSRVDIRTYSMENEQAVKDKSNNRQIWIILCAWAIGAITGFLIAYIWSSWNDNSIARFVVGIVGGVIGYFIIGYPLMFIFGIIGEFITPGLAEAKAKDAQERKRYEEDVAQVMRDNEKRIQPRIDANTAKGKSLYQEFDSIRIISKEDEPHLSRIIQLMESGRADNLKEALLLVDGERRRATDGMMAMWRQQDTERAAQQRWEESERNAQRRYDDAVRRQKQHDEEERARRRRLGIE